MIKNAVNGKLIRFYGRASGSQRLSLYMYPAFHYRQGRFFVTDLQTDLPAGGSPSVSPYTDKVGFRDQDLIAQNKISFLQDFRSHQAVIFVCAQAAFGASALHLLIFAVKKSIKAADGVHKKAHCRGDLKAFSEIQKYSGIHGSASSFLF